MDTLLNMVQAETARDKHFSGEPEAFAAWALRQIRPLAKRPGIQKQISDRRAKLHKELTSIEAQLQTSINTLQAKADRAIAALAVLDELDAPAAEPVASDARPVTVHAALRS